MEVVAYFGAKDLGSTALELTSGWVVNIFPLRSLGGEDFPQKPSK
tara:strand:+ start:891 stop:1025 length:135 start_codon:yes stop_codon:yes gene_type:complete